jgi:tRNA 2-thiocytidine biosynthesis protein TtcA
LNLRRLCRQIYSLLPLATRASPHDRKRPGANTHDTQWPRPFQGEKTCPSASLDARPCGPATGAVCAVSSPHMAREPLTRYERALRYLNRKVSRADREFDLLHEGDHVLVAVSGGKDSLVMLDILARRLAWHRIRYRLTACYVESGLCTPECTYREVLSDHCASLGVPLRVVGADPVDELGGSAAPSASDGGPQALEAGPSPCFLCSWRRRKALFLTAAEEGCGVVALGHHKDDLAQTLLLNLLWQGRHETMMPRREMFGGRLTIVRPLALAGESEIARVCRLGALPLHSCVCPHASASKREVAAELIRAARRAGCKAAVDNLVASSLRSLPRSTERPAAPSS